MQRLLPMALVLSLLVASAAAFAVTEGLKLTKSPIVGVRAMLPFSPVCGCAKARETIRLRLRTADELTLQIVDARHRLVRVVFERRPVHRGWNDFVWNGRTDEGAVASDGTYYARVSFAQAHKTITVPAKIALDTTPAKVLAASLNRTAFSPDGDEQSDSVTVAYRLDGVAHGALYLGDRRIGYSRFKPKNGRITWYGRSGGVALPAGEYRLRVGAVDVAGNATRARGSKFFTVRIRYVAATKARYVVLAGTRFSVRVDTDARAYTWRLGSRSGVESARSFVVRAPARAGRYRLVLSESGRSSAATVIVEPRG